MPAAVEKCVESMLKKWQKDPASRPKPKKKDQDEKSQAWAICTAAIKRQASEMAEAVLTSSVGHGPTLIGAAATNRPYIKRLHETTVIEDGDKKLLLVHLARAGTYDHFHGPFVLNADIFGRMIENFDNDVVGHKLAYDFRHLPDYGAAGWFVELLIGSDVKERYSIECDDDGLWGIVDPTSSGLEAVEDRRFLYSSMDFYFDYVDRAMSDDGAISMDGAIEIGNHEEEEFAMSDNVTLEDRLKSLEDELEAARAEARRYKLEAVMTTAQMIVHDAERHVGPDGNGLPAQFIEWVSRELSDDDNSLLRLAVDHGFEDKLFDAFRKLLEAVPTIVPVESKAVKAEADDEEFDFSALWGK